MPNTTNIGWYQCCTLKWGTKSKNELPGIGCCGLDPGFQLLVGQTPWPKNIPILKAHKRLQLSLSLFQDDNIFLLVTLFHKWGSLASRYNSYSHLSAIVTVHHQAPNKFTSSQEATIHRPTHRLPYIKAAASHLYSQYTLSLWKFVHTLHPLPPLVQMEACQPLYAPSPPLHRIFLCLIPPRITRFTSKSVCSKF